VCAPFDGTSSSRGLLTRKGAPAHLLAKRVKAARTGRRDSKVIEQALRRDLGLELFERIWAKANLGEAEALTLVVEEQHKARRG
jgi:cell division inhibitor SulA